MLIDLRGRRRRREREREKERHINVREKHRSVATFMCPDQGSNLQPFGLWDDDPQTESHNQGRVIFLNSSNQIMSF